ncbi:hypothetical protein [Halodesulfovibrio spirochaetisodalis]|uniref:Uncharacterized protein n=1 Tax=Halodesulfovibrio spirochaetisodalis TaxID=1560234 RepID=A0A1B7XAG7_9BACT|nr:hypothetical protein [Halodesulfovibrio spirochaetisodalis]OBQ46383.1 hypothetical protein SP90_12680 [Halodesulfovibrio spirochaetisodalis]
MKKALLIMALIALSFSLAACGSSGSSDSTDDTGSTPIIQKKQGCVSGAPVKGAQVYAKNNCDVTDEKIDCGGRDILVGVTDKNGCIIFDQEALAKLDRSKNVFLYSKGGMRFNCEYDCEADAKLKGAHPRKCYFKGQLRAVLAPGKCEAFLTLPNTLVHDLVKRGETLEVAENLVRKLICCWMSIKLMKDPLGNGCCELVNYEYIAQALLIGMGSCEEGLATNSPRYQKALRRAVRDIANWNTKNLRSYKNIPIDEVKGAMIPVLGEAYRAEIKCLTRDDIFCDNFYTVDLYSKHYKPACNDKRCNDCCVIPFVGDPPVFKFSVVATSNKPRKPGEFVVAALPPKGKLTANGKEVKVGDEFKGEERFRYILTNEEYEEALGKKVTFTFKAKNGCYVAPLIVCVKYLKKGDAVVTEFKRKQCDKIYEVEAIPPGTLDTSDPTVIKVVGGEYAKLKDGNEAVPNDTPGLFQLLTFTIDGEGVLRAGEELSVEVTAPFGFVFEYSDTATQEFKDRTEISATGAVFTSIRTFGSDKPVSDFVDYPLLETDEIGMLILRTTQNPQNVQKSNISAVLYFGDELMARCGEVLFEDEVPPCGCDFYIIAKGDGPTPCIPDSISIPEDFEDFLRGQGVIGTPGAGPSVNAPTRILITINPIGGTCPDDGFVFNPDEWTALVVNPDPPQNPVETGFGTGPYVVEVPLAEWDPAPQSRGTFGDLASGGPIPTVWAVFKAQPFNLGADAPFIVGPGPDNHYADIVFKYKRGPIELETNSFRIFERNPQSNP